MRAAFYETYRKEHGFFDLDAEIEDGLVCGGVVAKPTA
jgi:hypothetical protein